MNDSLAIYKEFDNVQRAATALYKSGYFKDATSEAQAIVKVMAGAELGLPPFASMTGINIIQGKPALGSNVIATLVKNDARYDYRIKSCTNTECELVWFENGKEVGASTFTIAEAATAGLSNKDNWKKYPSDMLFARAISRGARRYAPGIFGGSPVYTPEELGADEDEDGYIVDAVVKDYKTADDILHDLGYEDKDTKVEDPAWDPNRRPYPPEVLKERITERTYYYVKKKDTVYFESHGKILAKHLTTTFDGDNTKRYELCKWLVGETSTKKMSGATVLAMLDWLGTQNFDVPPSQDAINEAKTAHATALKAEGQQELL